MIQLYTYVYLFFFKFFSHSGYYTILESSLCYSVDPCCFLHLSLFIYYYFLILIFTLFYFAILYWFCHTLPWICHGCTWVPNPNPLQYSCLENFTNTRAWWATVQRVAKSRTPLNTHSIQSIIDSDIRRNQVGEARNPYYSIGNPNYH